MGDFGVLVPKLAYFLFLLGGKKVSICNIVALLGNDFCNELNLCRYVRSVKLKTSDYSAMSML